MPAGLTDFEAELAADGRILSSLSWLRQSGFSHRVADERMVIFAANGAPCAYCYSADQVVAFARRQSPVRGAGPKAKPSGKRANGADEAMDAAQLRDLEETIRYLRQRWHTTVAERDEWEKRARAAEEQLEALRAGGLAAAAVTDPKYVALRRFLARELHPDAAPASPEVRLLKSDLFKLVWAEITKLDRA